MQYYAKVNTAYPAAGFMPVGEVLTERQTAALGEELLAKLVREGVLGTLRDAEETTGTTLQPPAAAAPLTRGAKATEEAEDGEPETGTDEATEAAAGDEEELPELEVPEDIVSEAPKAAKPAKGAGRRKAK